ncbi:MAG TPA: Fic family protein [Pseudonocardiaceae bacterium]|jgi:Fic family protein|nr:Fic family protein [Pseudonocardiaceae bacterium]
MLYQVPRLTAADKRVLGEIEQFRVDLRYQVAHPPRWLGQLRRTLVAGAIRGSTTIEGYTINPADAEALASDEELSTDPDQATRDAVEGYKDALTYVQQAAKFDVFSYHPMLLSALHFMVLRHAIRNAPGRLRTGGIWVSGPPDEPPVYTGPEAELVPGLMDELCDWLERGDLDAPACVRAAMAHLNLVSIHPWKDGNGRMSRCLHTLVLAREQVLAPEFSSIEEWLGSSLTNTTSYYAALNEMGESYQPERDAHSWVRFSLTAHHKQAQLVRRRIEIAAQVWVSLVSLVAAAGLPERSVSAVYAGTRPGGVRRTTYAKDEELTRDQSVRDLQGLKAAGLVAELGHGRNQRYVAAGAAAETARAVRAGFSSRPLAEPYRSR